MSEVPDPVDRAYAPLLTRITQESLDEAYQHAAAQRAREDRPRGSRRRRHGVAAAVVAAFGLLVAVAAVQTSAQSGVASESRDSLLREIDQRQTQHSDMQGRIVDLQTLNIGLQEKYDARAKAAESASNRAARLAAQAGFAPVHGPGVVVTVDDAPDGEVVRAADLALLVNGLWEAGAEAITVNGKRVTARSALFNSGEAINLTGSPPLSPPYVVSAIGDNRTLQADLLDTTTGLQFSTVSDVLGFPVTMDDVNDITMPAAPQKLLNLSSAVEGTAKQNLKKHGKEPS